MRHYQIRFHLAQGEHFMHWQIKNLETGEVQYHNPDEVTIFMSYTKLYNQRSTAEKIHAGANKTVCAYIRCKTVLVVPKTSDECMYYKPELKIAYNPRVAPYWRNAQGENIDGQLTHTIVTKGNQLYGKIL